MLVKMFQLAAVCGVAAFAAMYRPEVKLNAPETFMEMSKPWERLFAALYEMKNKYKNSPDMCRGIFILIGNWDVKTNEVFSHPVSFYMLFSSSSLYLTSHSFWERST